MRPATTGASRQVMENEALQRVRVSGNLFFVPVTLANPGKGSSIWVRALLDSGCMRDLISLVLVDGLGLQTQELEEALIFEQMDGMIMHSKPCT